MLSAPRSQPWISATPSRERLSQYGLFEVETQTGARRELERDELPLAVIYGWEAELRKSLRVRARAPTRISRCCLLAQANRRGGGVGG
jgi:hypothetical protein